jgi:hypothetical protein
MSNKGVEISHYKVLSLSGILEKNAVYYVLDQPSGKVKTYITDKEGIPIPLIDLTGGTGSINSVTGTGVTGTSSNPIVNISTFVSSQLGNQVYLSLEDGKLQVNPITSPDSSIEVNSTNTELQLQLSSAIVSQINSALQAGDNISELVNDAGYITLADVPNATSFKREEFLYTSGAQIFTLSENYYQVFSVEVQGQGALSLSQYNLISPNQVQILDTLGTNDYVVVLYGVDLLTTVAPYYTQAEVDTLLESITSGDGNLLKISAENIPSYTPVAIYNNQAYKLDNLNPLHQFAFVGFSTNGTTIGQTCIIQQIGELTLSGWGLIQNSHYLAGASGAIQTDNTGVGFTKVIGYATTTDTLQILKDTITINK